MLPGDAPGRGPPPGRGAPGRGAWGRGIARSTGCAEENGLLPTRGVRGAGLGPGVAGRGPGSGAGARGCGCGCRLGHRCRHCGGCLGLCGCRGGCSTGAAGLGAGAFSGAGALAAAFLAGAPLPPAVAFSAAGFGAAEGFAQPARDGGLHGGGCGFDEFALFTQSGEYFLAGDTEFFSQLVYAGLACHFSPVLEATAVVGPRLGFSYDAWSSSELHGVLMFFATCSLAGCWGTSSASKYASTADVSGEPVMRNARANARRRIAACKHCWSGCNQAPRPGRLPAASTVTAQSPFPMLRATTRSSSTASSRFRQPTHVRTGPSVLSMRRSRSLALDHA